MVDPRTRQTLARNVYLARVQLEVHTTTGEMTETVFFKGLPNTVKLLIDNFLGNVMGCDHVNTSPGFEGQCTIHECTRGGKGLVFNCLGCCTVVCDPCRLLANGQTDMLAYNAEAAAIEL